MNNYKIRLSDDALKSYLFFKSKDKNTFRRLIKILKNIQETPFSGLGKPEPLRFSLSGFWSRRLDKKNRIVYEVLQDRRTSYNKYYSNRKSLL